MIKMRYAAAFLAACMVLSVPRTVAAATATLAPAPYQTVADSSGAPISGACVWTYQAGTSTPAETYTSKAATVANSNPITTDASGQFVAYLLPGQSYKFVYETACVAPAHGSVLRTQDGIDAVPASSNALDVTGTAGENIGAGLCAYLSLGLGGKTPGQLYLCDSANAYSSTLAEVIGIAPSAILSSASGTIRIAGSVTGLAALSIGTDYYAGTAGALTGTAPTNARKLGPADTTTSVILPLPVLPLQSWANDFRLTLTTATPVTAADVTGASATTVYCSPYWGNRIDLPDASGTPSRYASAEFSIALPATTSQMYDVFVYANVGVPTLELLAWTNDTTRATAIIRSITGRYYKTGDLTRMYLGSVRTSTVAGQSEDSYAKRLLWNYYNRVASPLRRLESTASWAYSLAAYRQANGSTANQLAIVVGVAEAPIDVRVYAGWENDQAAAVGRYKQVGIGENSTTANATGVLEDLTSSALTGGYNVSMAFLTTIPAAGYSYYAWLEYSEASGITTWYGTLKGQTGMQGMFQR